MNELYSWLQDRLQQFSGHDNASSVAMERGELYMDVQNESLGAPLADETVDVVSRELELGGLVLPVVKAVCVSVLFTTALAANLLVFAVFYHKPILLTTSNKLLTHHSATQCLLLLMLIPLWTASIFGVHWTATPYACVISGIGISALFTVSIYTLVLVALDRFYAITRPLHYTRTVTVRRVAVCLSLIWLMAIIISLPPLAGWGQITFYREYGICTVDWLATSMLHKSYAIFMVFMCFVIPLLTKTCLYGFIYSAARRATSRAKRFSLTPDHMNAYDVTAYLPHPPRRRSSTVSLATMVTRRRSSFGTRSVSSLMRDDLLAAKTALMALLSFVGCWLMYSVLHIVDTIRAPVPMPGWVYFIGLYLVVLSCLVNPIVYVFRSKVVKETLCVSGYATLICRLCPCATNPNELGPDRPFPPLLRISGKISLDPSGGDLYETSESQGEVRHIVATSQNSTGLNLAIV